jgi:hypothetical protein
MSSLSPNYTSTITDIQLPTETFWSAFDWDDPAAHVHAKQIPIEEMNENKSITIDGEEVEWTKDGMEQILATVGIQCVYNSDVSPLFPSSRGFIRSTSRDGS